TMGARAPPANSTWTSSRPRSRAARSAISRTRASTEPPSSKALAPFKTRSRAKEKVGQKPTGNATALRARGELYGMVGRVATRQRRTGKGQRVKGRREYFYIAALWRLNLFCFTPCPLPLPQLGFNDLVDRPPVCVAPREP